MRLGYGAARRRRRKELLAFPSSTRRSPMPFRGRCRRGRAQRHPERVVEIFLFSSPTAHPPPHIPPLICRQKCIGVGVGSGRPWSAVVARSSEYYCGGGGKTAPATREDAFPQAPEKFYRKAIQSFSERTLTIEGGGRAALGFRPHSHVHRNGGGGRKGALLTN